MKYALNKETGKRYCLHCKRYDCICLPESDQYLDYDFCTKLEVKEIINITKKADKLIFYKQTLPNGRVIRSNCELVVPTGKYYRQYQRPRQVILLSNDIINISFYEDSIL